MSTVEERTQRWLDSLRDGSEADKLTARRGLARVFEERGMLDEAIELLERNVEAGVHGAETLRWLSRLYEARETRVPSLVSDDDGSTDGWAPFIVEQPAVAGLRTPPLQAGSFGDLAPYLAMTVGLGIALGTGLWMMAPHLRP